MGDVVLGFGNEWWGMHVPMEVVGCLRAIMSELLAWKLVVE